MDNHELIQDTGLFVGQKLFEFTLAESFESITNLFQTIKQYREFANPNETAWFEYIHQIFHIFGFTTAKIAPRLISLQEVGANQTPKALVCIIGPKEDFTQIVFGLDWESYLFYAAKFHQVEWAILTNGLQFKVLNYGDNADNQKYFKCELDEIIKNGKTDSFFTLYKIFSVINHGKDARTDDHKELDDKHKERHFLRKDFWAQLIARSKGKTTLFEKKTPGVEHYLNTGGGKKGVYLVYIIANSGARVELSFEIGDANWNKRIFDSFLLNKVEIENAFGNSLIWDRLDNKRASIIRYTINQWGLKDKDKWPELQDQMIEAMIKFERIFRPFIQKIG
jgi:hypothetical protein